MTCVPILLPVTFVMSQVIHAVGAPIDDVFFVEDGLVSLTADAGDDSQVEVGMTGREGLVGTSRVCSTRRQSPSIALSFRFQVPRSECERTLFATWPTGIPHFVIYVFAISTWSWCRHAKRVACNVRHEMPNRLARWLLMTCDRVGGNEVPMTQDFLAMMLGVRRAGVSVATGALEEKGLIHQSRGRVVVTNRVGLEKQACNCYRVMDDCQRQVMAITPWVNDPPLAA